MFFPVHNLRKNRSRHCCRNFSRKFPQPVATFLKIYRNFRDSLIMTDEFVVVAHRDVMFRDYVSVSRPQIFMVPVSVSVSWAQVSVSWGQVSVSWVLVSVSWVLVPVPWVLVSLTSLQIKRQRER